MEARALSTENHSHGEDGADWVMYGPPPPQARRVGSQRLGPAQGHSVTLKDHWLPVIGNQGWQILEETIFPLFSRRRVTHEKPSKHGVRVSGLLFCLLQDLCSSWRCSQDPGDTGLRGQPASRFMCKLLLLFAAVFWICSVKPQLNQELQPLWTLEYFPK